MKIRGEIFALGAAICNGSIGIFSRFGFAGNTDHTAVAFFRCIGGFLILTALLSMRSGGMASVLRLHRQWIKIAIVAFFGIFTLYFFEIWSLVYAPIPVVSVLTYAGGVLSIILGIIFLKEELTAIKILTCAFVFLGVYMMFSSVYGLGNSIFGAFLAVIAGVGYSLFLFLWRLFGFSGGLTILWWFFGFGMLYLGVPYVAAGAPLPTFEALPGILGLIFVPTLLGYYCTSRALDLIEVGRVQLIETTEPLFSSLLALLFMGEMLSPTGALGAVLILLGLIMLIVPIGRCRVLK